jgi:hypothetical protein
VGPRSGLDVLENRKISPLPGMELTVSVRWTPLREGVSPGAEERPLLKDVTKQGSEDHHQGHSLCVTVICIVLSRTIC